MMLTLFRMKMEMSIFLVLLFTAGCAPTFPEEELQRIHEVSQPQQRDTEYKERFEAIRKIINKGLGNTTYVQVMPDQFRRDLTPTEMLLGNLAERVEGSVINLSGELLRVVSYDPEYIPILEKQVSDLTLPTPDLVVKVSLGAFDRDVKKKSSKCDLSVYIPAVIEGEDVDTDIMAECEKAESISRIAIDLRLIDYRTRTLFPKMQVSNMIFVFEIERERNLGFMIYGSGLGRTEQIEIKQGLQQAVKNLIDYSVLELFSMYYSIPFWQNLPEDTLSSTSQEWLTEWRRNFLNLGEKQLGPQRQIGQIQHWLTKYDALPPVYVEGCLVNEIPETEYGTFGRVTQAFILKFLYQYAPESSLIQFVERNKLSEEELTELYISLIQHIPII